MVSLIYIGNSMEADYVTKLTLEFDARTKEIDVKGRCTECPRRLIATSSIQENVWK